MILYLVASYTDVLPPVPAGNISTLQDAVQAHTKRIQVLDGTLQKLQRDGAPVQLQNRVEDLEEKVASLGEAGTGQATDSDLAAQVADLQQQVTDLSQSNVGADLSKLRDRVASLEKSTSTAASNGAAASSKAVDDLQKSVGTMKDSLGSLQSDLGTVRDSVASLQSRLDQLQQRVEAVAQASQGPSQQTQDKMASLGQTVDQLSGTVNELQQAVQKTQSELKSRLQSLQGDLARTDASARQILALTSLRRAVESGQPYATELAMLKALSPQGFDTQALDGHAQQGVASDAELKRNFDRVTTELLIAGEDRTNGYVNEMMDGLRSLVRVRPAADTGGEGRAATVTRIDQALQRGDIAAAYKAWQSLDEAARNAAPDFGQMLQARAQAEQELASLTDAISGSGKTDGSRQTARRPAGPPATPSPPQRRTDSDIMIRAFLYLLVVAALAYGASWLADLPGSFQLTVAGYQFETSLLVAFVLLLVVVGLVMILWAVISWIFRSPQAVSGFFRSRRRDKGYQALSRGMVAAAAGDVRLAKHYSAEARRLVPRESLSLLLSAQSAQLSGDRAAARRAFEAMAERPDTELLGLRGLYIEATREGDYQAARQYAEAAAGRAPSLPWAGNALLDYQTREHDWNGALTTVKRNADARLIDRKAASRQRAVLLTAQAQEIEDEDQDRALALALEAHKLAPDLVPAAVIAGRLSAATGSTRQATKVIERTWKDHPHPDLAEVYAHARQGDSARDRLKRVRALADKRPHENEGAIAVAVAAIEAREWTAAREALQPVLRDRPTRRACMLMAEIEEGENGDAGRVREWLSRALRAPRDPAWIADGYISEEWQPVSPVTGELDAFEWRTPPELLAEHAEDEAEGPVPPAIAAEAAKPTGPAAVSAPAAPEPGPAEHKPAEPKPADSKAAASKPAAPEKPAAAEPSKPAQPQPAPAPSAEPATAAAVGAAAPATATPARDEKAAAGKGETAVKGDTAATGKPAGAAEPATPTAAAGPTAAAKPAATPEPQKPAAAPAAAAKPAQPAANPGGKPAATRSEAARPAGTSTQAGSRDESMPRPPDDPGPDANDDPDEPPRRMPVL